MGPMIQHFVHTYMHAHIHYISEGSRMIVYTIDMLDFTFFICDRVCENTPIHFIISISFSVWVTGYTISICFIEFLRKFCVYDDIFDKVLC